MLADPSSALSFIEGPINSEDIAHVPGTRWVIASGMTSVGHPQGHLYLVDRDAHSAEDPFPGAVDLAGGGASLPESAPPDVASFNAHGLSLRTGDGGQHTLATALDVDGELWLASPRSDRIASVAAAR